MPPSSTRIKERLDQHLVRLGLAPSREQAKRLIIAGEVQIGTHIWDKPSAIVPSEATATVKEKPKFVGVREVASVGAKMSRRAPVSGVEIRSIDGA